MERKSFTHFASMMQLLHDYASKRLREIREEAKTLELILGNEMPEEATSPPPSQNIGGETLRSRVQRELRVMGEARPKDIAARLIESGWAFTGRNKAYRSVANALNDLVRTNQARVRKEGDAKSAAVFYSINDAPPETEHGDGHDGGEGVNHVVTR
jgi:hypothetical protein